MFAIGDKEWPGLSKLMEEAGEVIQVGGKLMGTRGEVLHWDGTYLDQRLAEELGDLMAAIEFFVTTNFASSSHYMRFINQAKMKLELFRKWHAENPKLPEIPIDLEAAQKSKHDH